MRRIVGLILLSAVVIAAAWWIKHLAGGLSLQVGHTTIQAPLSVAVLGLIVLVVLIYVGTRILATIFRLPGAFRSGGERRARRRGEAAVTSTLTALAAREPADGWATRRRRCC
jgi:uncharacterized protein HemY